MGHLRAPRPVTCMHCVAVVICSKLLTWIARPQIHPQQNGRASFDAQAARSADDEFGFSEMILVFTGPQSAHMKFSSATSRRLGCGSATPRIIGLVALWGGF